MRQSAPGMPHGLSGEILTASAAPVRAPRPKTPVEVVEAEFEVVRGNPPAKLASYRTAPPGPVITVGRPSKSGGFRFWSLGLLAAGCAFWMSGGLAFFAAPAPAVVKIPPLIEFAGVTSSVDRSGDAALVMVDGDVFNPGKRSAAVPAIAIAVTDKNAATTRYLLRTANARIEPGQQFAFSGRLSLPKTGAETVRVEFAE